MLSIMIHALPTNPPTERVNRRTCPNGTACADFLQHALPAGHVFSERTGYGVDS